MINSSGCLREKIINEPVVIPLCFGSQNEQLLRTVT